MTGLLLVFISYQLDRNINALWLGALMQLIHSMLKFYFSSANVQASRSGHFGRSVCRFLENVDNFYIGQVSTIHGVSN